MFKAKKKQLTKKEKAQERIKRLRLIREALRMQKISRESAIISKGGYGAAPSADCDEVTEWQDKVKFLRGNLRSSRKRAQARWKGR